MAHNVMVRDRIIEFTCPGDFRRGSKGAKERGAESKNRIASRGVQIYTYI